MEHRDAIGGNADPLLTPDDAMTTHKIGRNDPCPCGSDRKCKQCCGKKTDPSETPADSHENAVARGSRCACTT